MRSLLFVFLLCSSYQVWAQNTTSKNPASNKTDFQKIGLKTRFIILPIGNGHITSSLLGLNVALTKRHHIGIDFNYLTGIDRSDDVTDTLGNKHTSGKEFNSKENVLFFYYHYYFNLFHQQEKQGLRFLIGPYFRYGKEISSYDQLFQVAFTKRHETNYSVGFVVGIIQKIEPVKRLSIEATAGFFEKKRSADIEYRENGQLLYKTEKTSNFGSKLDVNLYWRLF